MRGVQLALDVWLDPAHPRPARAYLDPADWDAFVRWVRQDTANRLPPLTNGIWNIRLFPSLASRYLGVSRRRTTTLRALGIEIIDQIGGTTNELFVTEVLRSYFHDDPGARLQAELLAQARRSEANGRVAIVSQMRDFSRIPLVDTYFLDATTRRGRDDLPADFELYNDLAIHRELIRAVADRLNAAPNGDTINAALMGLRDQVRVMSGLGQDGRTLMEQAFKADGSHLRLNPLTDPDPEHSQMNEQKGFKEIYCGAWTALRNPLLHEGVNSAFAQARYADVRTVIKYLAFLSILYERADGPLA